LARVASGVIEAVSVASLYQTVVATALPEPSVSVKLIVLNCTAWLKVAAIGNIASSDDDTGTLVAPGGGLSPISVGAPVFWGAVVNDQVTGAAIATPELFSAPLIETVYVVPYANDALGVMVTVLVDELYAAVAATLAVPLLIDQTIVLDCTASLKVAVGAVLTARPVAPAAGVSAVMVGAGCAAVVNVQVSAPVIGSP
jgi:hypothetical protein